MRRCAATPSPPPSRNFVHPFATVGRVQRTFDDLGTPLVEVTFCVVDVETTGTSPATDALTEIGAVKVRGGEIIGTLQTLVNPGRGIPPEITYLTGITEAMVAPAPRITAVLPTLADFLEGTVVVGHNVRFDVSFLDAALTADHRPRLANPTVDTCALARRLVRDEVPNCRLGTLAERFRLHHKPTHRALDDALATMELLHLLLERAARLGVLGLDDLLALPRLGGHPQVGKLRLTTDLPRRPGVYRFLGASEEVLYVGKATDLRQRVRSYFSGDERRRVGGLLREVHRIDHLTCATTLEAAVREHHLIRHHRPRYNAVGKGDRANSYVRFDPTAVFPRLVVGRTPGAGPAVTLGPLPAGLAGQVVEAVESALPLRRCTLRPRAGGPPLREGPCAPARLGVASCPCAGGADAAGYATVVRRTLDALQGRPEIVLEPLAERMRLLAAQERFEEAATVRDRAEAFARVVRRQRRVDSLRRSGRLRIQMADGGGAELVGGRLVTSWTAHDAQPRLVLLEGDVAESPDDDELTCVGAWLDAEAGRLRIDTCDGLLSSPATRVPSFQARRSPIARR